MIYYLAMTEPSRHCVNDTHSKPHWATGDKEVVRLAPRPATGEIDRPEGRARIRALAGPFPGASSQVPKDTAGRAQEC